MKLNDAAKILDIDGEITPEIVKKAYRRACAKYHPDRNPAGLEMMKAVNAAYDVLKDYQGAVEKGAEGYDDALNDVINAILTMNLPNVTLEVCGAWLWVTGDTKPHSKALGRREGGLGLYFASKKKAWYFRPDDWKSSSRGSLSLDEIRDKHGSQIVRGSGRQTIEQRSAAG